MAREEILVIVKNIKHRKVIARLSRGTIAWRLKSLIFVFLVSINTARALPDIIKIGKIELMKFHICSANTSTYIAGYLPVG